MEGEKRTSRTDRRNDGRIGSLACTQVILKEDGHDVRAELRRLPVIETRLSRPPGIIMVGHSTSSSARRMGEPRETTRHDQDSPSSCLCWIGESTSSTGRLDSGATKGIRCWSCKPNRGSTGVQQTITRRDHRHGAGANGVTQENKDEQ
jgi:hypothetical protein